MFVSTTKNTDMGLKIITEEEARLMAIECGNQVFLQCLEKFFPSSTQPKNVPDNDVLFTKKELAEYWHCHPQTITQKKLRGELPFIQHGRKLLFRKSEIDKLTTVSLAKKGR